MQELNRELLLNIEGGLNITGSLIGSFTRAVNSILDVGRSLGSAIRRINSGKICSL